MARVTGSERLDRRRRRHQRQRVERNSAEHARNRCDSGARLGAQQNYDASFGRSGGGQIVVANRGREPTNSMAAPTNSIATTFTTRDTFETGPDRRADTGGASPSAGAAAHPEPRLSVITDRDSRSAVFIEFPRLYHPVKNEDLLLLVGGVAARRAFRGANGSRGANRGGTWLANSPQPKSRSAKRVQSR